MPSLQVVDLSELPADKPEPSQVERLFSEYKKYNKERKEGEEIQKLTNKYLENKNQEGAWEKLQFDLMNNTEIGPTKRLETQNQLKEMRTQILKERELIAKEVKEKKDQEEEEKKKKEEADKEKKLQEESKALLLANGVDKEEATRLSKILTPANAKTYGKGSGSVSKEEQVFRNAMATSGAKEAQELDKEISKQQDILENIGTVEKLMTEQLTGIEGYAKGFLNTESASQVRTLGASNLGGVIKLFNPAGTLPTAKLNWITKTFSVSPLDNTSEAKGKLNTQKILATQAIQRAKERSALLKQYSGNVPESAIKKFDKETVDMITAIQEQVDPESIENKVMKDKPSAKDNEGRTIKDENGKKFKSNGKEWVPV